MKKLFPLLLILILFQQCLSSNHEPSDTVKADEYTCLPCGYDCDSATYDKGGTCEKCKMQLVKKSTITFSNIHPAALYKFIKDKGKENVLLLDVRTPYEFEGTASDKFGRLEGAINIPMQQLKERLSELENYKDKEIVVYCSHSHRSPAASYMLTQSGFTKVSNLQHGMYLWKQDVKDKESNDSLYVAQ